MNMLPSPRASRPYLHWLSSRSGGFASPSCDAIADVNEWLEWRESTLSMYRASWMLGLSVTCSRVLGHSASTISKSSQLHGAL